MMSRVGLSGEINPTQEEFTQFTLFTKHTVHYCLKVLDAPAMRFAKIGH
jgi:hypothetical protein